MPRKHSTLESRLAKTIIGRIDRYRDGKSDLASLALELHLFVETYDRGPPELVAEVQAAWDRLATTVGSFMQDPDNVPQPDHATVAGHLAEMESLLRRI